MTTAVRVLVTGSRQWANPNAVNWALSAVKTVLARDPLLPGMVVVHGGADGADTCAENWVATTSNRPIVVTTECHPADWRRNGRAAGLIRNQRMVNLGADLCLAFFWDGAGNRGTADCTERADLAAIPTRRITMANWHEEVARILDYPEGWLPQEMLQTGWAGAPWHTLGGLANTTGGAEKKGEGGISQPPPPSLEAAP